MLTIFVNRGKNEKKNFDNNILQNSSLNELNETVILLEK